MDNAGLLKEERDRVFELYATQANSFRRSLTWLLMISVTIFALFVVPFLGFSVQLASSKALAVQAKQERTRNEELLAQRKEELETIGDLLNLANSYGTRARAFETYQEWIREAKAKQPFIQSKREEYQTHSDVELRKWATGDLPTPPADVFSRVRYVDMGVSHHCEWRLSDENRSLTNYVACRACGSFRKVNDQVVHRLNRLSIEKLPEGVGPTELTAIMERACGFLIGGEIHWQRKRPLHPDPNRIRGYLTHDIRAYSEVLRELGSELSELLPDRSKEIEALEAELAIAEGDEAELLGQLDRLSKFDRLGTPFGEVPITLNQLALLFPIAVAAGFLVIAASFGRMATLHHEFTRLSAIFDEDGEVISAAHLNAVAPMWLNRSEAPAALGLKWAILLIPAGLVLATCALIHQSDTFAEAFPEGSAISSAVYYALYAISLLLVAGGILHIWRCTRVTDRSL